jgi:small-conductance mechanosensitive channel
MRALRTPLLGLLYAAIWPTYLGLMAYAARQAPWPRNFAIAGASVLLCLALAALVAGLARGLLRPRGWAESTLRVPPAVVRQLRHAVLALVLAAVALLIPEMLLSEGLIAPGGRPISAPISCQLLVLGFELTVWGVVFHLLDRRAALVQWLTNQEEQLGWLNRHRRPAAASVLAAIGAVIVLDARGYSFTARRLSVGAGETLVLLALCWGLYRLILQAIDHHAWRWIRVGPTHPHAVEYAAGEATDAPCEPDDLAGRLRRLAAYLVPLLGVFLAAWIWDVDLALFKFLGGQKLWLVDATKAPTPTYATVGDATAAVVILLLTIAAWRHISTLFAVAVFPRMPDDPGMRFAVVTLCRYAVLGLGLLTGLSSIHLGPDKIGMVLAALGVGLGFGLQEIVSNFVCGIILLLERPIRVGDIVTVSAMTGSVDRINIRATTIINGENQSIIIPNRAFITGHLVNWTLRDKIIRVTLRLKVAYGTDPDRVSDLLLGVARDDADVLRNPVPSSFMEDFGDSALIFALHVHVPDPSLGGRVRHRLFAQIQKRFSEAEIEIPLPAQELTVRPMGDLASARPGTHRGAHRYDPAQPAPPASWLGSFPQSTPAPVESCHRGVDE